MGYQVGQKVVLERTPIYAGSGNGTYKQTTREISKVSECGSVQFKGQRNYEWFRSNSDFLETKTLRYRVIG